VCVCVCVPVCVVCVCVCGVCVCLATACGEGGGGGETVSGAVGLQSAVGESLASRQSVRHQGRQEVHQAQQRPRQQGKEI
jgi:hypothetical protein